MGTLNGNLKETILVTSLVSHKRHQSTKVFPFSRFKTSKQPQMRNRLRRDTRRNQAVPFISNCLVPMQTLIDNHIVHWIFRIPANVIDQLVDPVDFSCRTLPSGLFSCSSTNKILRRTFTGQAFSIQTLLENGAHNFHTENSTFDLNSSA